MLNSLHTVPKFDTSVGVELRICMYLVNSDANGAGTRVPTEVVADMPRCQQTHFENTRLVLSTGLSRHKQHQCDQRQPHFKHHHRRRRRWKVLGQG